MGIYDAGGKLVRTLHREAQASDFVIDIDGLVTKWDGKDDAGRPVEPGKYRARGYLVGEFDFEGQAFHCNDWIVDESSPRIRRVVNLRALPGDELVLLVQTGDKKLSLLRCDAKGSVLWNHPLPEDFDGRFLAVNGSFAFVASGTQIAQFDLKNGTGSFWEPKFAALSALAADDHSMLVADDAKIQRYKVEDRSHSGDYPADKPAEALAIQNEKIVAISDGKILVREGENWRNLDLGATENAQEICFNPEGCLWLIVSDGPAREVREYSPGGEFRRRLAIKTAEPAPQKVSASTAGDQIFLLEQNAQMQRLRALTLVGTEAPKGGNASTSKWRVGFSKSIWFSDDLKAVAGQLRTASGHDFAPQEKAAIKLRANPLTQKQSASAEVSVGMDAAGSYLKLADGLPLRGIAETRNLRAVAMMPEPGGQSLTIFQSDGAVVEEFKAGRLENMMAFDCGEFDFPESKADKDETR